VAGGPSAPSAGRAARPGIRPLYRLLGAALFAILATVGAAAGAERKIDPAIKNKLLANLKADSMVARASAARTLGRMYAPEKDGEKPSDTEEIVKALKELMQTDFEEKSWPVRRACCRALGAIGHRNRDSINALRGALGDGDLEVVLAAMHGLERLLSEKEMRERVHEELDTKGHPRAAAARYLVDKATPEDVPALAKWLTLNDVPDEDWRIRTYCARALGRVASQGGTLPPKVCGDLAELLDDNIQNVIDAAKRTLLIASKRSNDAVVTALAAAAKPSRPAPPPEGEKPPDDTSWRRRVHALDVLAKIGVGAVRKHLDVVIVAVGDDTVDVSAAGQKALATIPAAERYPLLLDALDKADNDARRAGLLTALSTGLPVQHRAKASKLALAALQASQGRSARLRIAGLQLLSASDAAAAAEVIAAAVADDSPAVRRAAVGLLSRAAPKIKGSAAIATAIGGWIEPKEETWRKGLAAARALRVVPCKEGVEPLVKRGLTHPVINVKAAAVDALIQYGREAELKAEVEKQLLAETKAGRAAWEYGARVFGHLKTRAAVPRLVEMIEAADAGKDHWRTLVNACRALGQIGVKNDKAIAALEVCSRNEVLQVQDAADRALRILGTEQK
jgi:hypothetical protein